MTNTFLEYVDSKNQDRNFIVSFPNYGNEPTVGVVVARGVSSPYKIGETAKNWCQLSDYKEDESERFIKLKNIEAARLYHDYDRNLFPAPTSSVEENVRELKRKFDLRQISDDELLELAALINNSVLILSPFGYCFDVETKSYLENIEKIVKLRRLQ